MNFTIEPHNRSDKSFAIHGPDDLVMNVDYDDVNHEVVDELAASVVHWLNRMPQGDIDFSIAVGNRRAEEIARREEGEWARGIE